MQKDFNIREKELLKDLVDIGNHVYNNKGHFDKNDFNSMCLFGTASFNVFGKTLDFEKMKEQKPELFKKFEKQRLKDIRNFYDFIRNNNEILLPLFTNAEKVLEESMVPILIERFDCSRRYNKEDFKNIILDFYGKYYNVARKYFDENRIQTDYTSESYLGMYIYSKLVSSGYVLLNEGLLDSKLAATLIHELGHAISAETFIFPQQKKLSLFSDIYVELPSIAFERLFAENLEKEKIDTTGGMIINNISNRQIYHYAQANSVFLTFNNFIYDSKTGDLLYKMIDDDTFYSYKLRDSILYGLGHIFSLYFRYLDNNDRKEFLRVYNNIITSRGEATLEEMIKMLGISVEDFIDFKYVKDDIKEDTMKLKKRFNYDGVDYE